MDGTDQFRRLLLGGMVIPAHPLALTAERRLDERRQAALTRYYCDAGAGGIAVGVHTTQFAIRDPCVGLYSTVLRLAANTAREHEQRTRRRIVKIAGVCGRTEQAVSEAGLARDLGYDAALLSLAGWAGVANAGVIAHCRAVAPVLPLFGFYLQPVVGGRPLDEAFWREFLTIPNVVAIKVAPFDRYRTLDVVRALAASGREAEVALYTGNDDNVVADLLTEFPGATPDAPHVRFAGGLLGQWAVWTRRAVELLDEVRVARTSSDTAVRSVLTLGAQLTDANAALFDAANGFKGCLPGIHEALRRQGLLAGRWCLDPAEVLSPGQLDAIDRVHTHHPHLRDDAFVAEHLERWLA